MKAIIIFVIIMSLMYNILLTVFYFIPMEEIIKSRVSTEIERQKYDCANEIKRYLTNPS